MKKLLLLAALFCSLGAMAQNTTPSATSMTFFPFQACRVHSSDSVQILFLLQSGNTVASITVTQTAGTSIKFTAPSPVWSGNNASVAFWLQGLAPGNYTFTAVGKDVAGNSTTVSQNLMVVADPVCPVCATCPAQRSVASVSFPLPAQTLTILGQTFTIPAQTLIIPASALPAGSIKFSDGSQQ